MNTYNDKKQWIETLAITAATIKGSKGNADERLTFITNLGYITGKIAELPNITAESEAEFREVIAERIAKGIDVFTLNKAVYRESKASTLKKGSQVENNDTYIVIEDVRIMPLSNPEYKMTADMMAIFVDQIVGVLPGAIDFK